MAIHFGNDKIKEIYVGSDKIKEVYHGLDLVWRGSKPSYVILTNNTRVEFNATNTPITNFCRAFMQNTITINGINLSTSNLKEIVFEDDYMSVISIPENFLRNMDNLTSVDFSKLANVEEIGGFMLYNSNAFLYVDLGALYKLSVLGSGFIQGAVNIKTVKVGASTPPIAGGGLLVNSGIETIYVPSASVNAYKSAEGWSVHASKIQGY
jgi:hypothetical protein